MFENTFQKYTTLIIEEINAKRKLTKEQNLGLKKIYIILRDCLKDTLRDAKESGVTVDNYSHRFEDFMRDYEPKNPYVEVIDKETIKVSLPEDVQKIFRILNKSISLKIVAKTKPILKTGSFIAKAGLERGHGGIKAIYIRIDMLFKNFNEIKAELQHEIQHIVHHAHVSGVDGDEKAAYVKYYCDAGEISAHCKEYAYRYFKKYPDDDELDFEKFKDVFYKKKLRSVDVYIDFGESNNAMEKRAYTNFVYTLKTSFGYFKE